MRPRPDPLHVAANEEADELLAFFIEIYPNLPAFLSLHKRCQQEEVWTSADGVERRVAELDVSHAQNLVRWLERRAEALKIAAHVEASYEAARHVGGDQAQYELEHWSEETLEMSAKKYLCQLPLYRAVSRRARSEDSHGPTTKIET